MIPFGRSDPSKKLDKLSLDKLADEETRLGVRADGTNAQLKQLRAQYDALLSGRRPEETDNDVRLRASKARQLRPQIERLQQDFDALLAQQETVTALIEQRRGTEAVRGAKRLDKVTGKMSDHELGKALEGRQKEVEKARAQTEQRRGRLSEGTGAGSGELSEEERMINSAPAPTKKAEEPATNKSTKTKPQGRE
ncbi:MAG: hypothetical protein V4510_05675 [bacterium]